MELEIIVMMFVVALVSYFISENIKIFEVFPSDYTNNSQITIFITALIFYCCYVNNKIAGITGLASFETRINAFGALVSIIVTYILLNFFE